MFLFELIREHNGFIVLAGPSLAWYARTFQRIAPLAGRLLRRVRSSVRKCGRYMLKWVLTDDK